MYEEQYVDIVLFTGSPFVSTSVLHVQLLALKSTLIKSFITPNKFLKKIINATSYILSQDVLMRHIFGFDGGDKEPDN